MSSEAILFGFLPDRSTRIRQAISMLKQSGLSFSIHSNIKKIDEDQSITIDIPMRDGVRHCAKISIDSIGNARISIDVGDREAGVNLLNFAVQILAAYGVELENITYG
jgi:hypothetical protein